MEHELSEQTRRRIADHCRRIAVAQSLDPEIQRELAGHMEDKILGYLSGEERLSEEDAFVIARERFGDPALIKELLGDVHAGPAAASLGRRALALALMMNLYTLLAFGLHTAILFVFNSFNPPPRLQAAMHGYLHPFLMIAISGAFYWALYRKLKWWKAELAEGQRPWALRWPAWAIAWALLATFCLRPPVKMLKDFERLELTGMYPSIEPWVYLVMVACLCALIVGMAILWLWWCDSAPRRPRAALQASFWCIAYAFAGSVLDSLIWSVPSPQLHPRAPVVFQGDHWTFYLIAPGWSNLLGELLFLTAMILLGLLGRWRYETARRKNAKADALTSGLDSGERE